MNNHRDYESLAFSAQRHDRMTPCLLEAYRGVSVVSWYGNIERQLVDLFDEFKRNKNPDEAVKVEQFLQTWRAHKLSGSVNIEDVMALEAACAQVAVDKWKASNYFSHLRDQLRVLQASEEELPREEPPETRMPRSGSGPSTPRRAAGPQSQFGPEGAKPKEVSKAPTGSGPAEPAVEEPQA